MLSFNIIKESRKLTKPCKQAPLEEGLALGEKMMQFLKSNSSYAGLAANQIGMNMRVCVINVSEPIILVNPKIVSQFGKYIFKEACLSFPGDYIKTERYANIMIMADNHKKALIFTSEKDPLECACVQHEIDHLNGITMFDRRVKDEKG